MLTADAIRSYKHKCMLPSISVQSVIQLLLISAAHTRSTNCAKLMLLCITPNNLIYLDWSHRPELLNRCSEMLTRNSCLFAEHTPFLLSLRLALLSRLFLKGCCTHHSIVKYNKFKSQTGSNPLPESPTKQLHIYLNISAL